MHLTLRITQPQIRLLLKLTIAVNLFLLLGTYIINNPEIHLSYPIRLVLNQTDLALENVSAAWYSSMLLFLSAIMSLVCFFIDTKLYTKGNAALFNFGWIIFTGCFAVLSFDELGSFHEQIGNFSVFENAGDALIANVKEPGWKLFYVLVGLVGLFMLLFSFFRLRHDGWPFLFLITGVLLYLSNPFQEEFEIATMRDSGHPATWKRPVYFLLIEEGSELFGSLSFLIATVLYASRTRKEVFLELTSKLKTYRAIIFGMLITALIGTIAVHVLFNVMADKQTGVPKNWPPAVVAFVISLMCVYQFANNKLISASQRIAFLIFGLFSVAMSLYYGCNRFNYIFTGDHYRSSILFRVLVLVAALIAFSHLNKIFATSTTRILAIVSMLSIIFSAFVAQTFAAEAGVLGFGLMGWILSSRITAQY
jgi:hypothetical protein